MKNRILAILAMIALTFAAGAGSVLATPAGEPGPPADPPPCGPDSDNPRGCDDEAHPGKHENEDPGEGESQCAGIAEIEGPLNENGVPTDGQIQAGCEELENTVTGIVPA